MIKSYTRPDGRKHLNKRLIVLEKKKNAIEKRMTKPRYYLEYDFKKDIQELSEIDIKLRSVKDRIKYRGHQDHSIEAVRLPMNTKIATY